MAGRRCDRKRPMKLSGRLQRSLWNLRLRLREWPFLRQLVHRARSLAPDSRERHLRGEVRFWRRWLASEGLSWPEDFTARLDPSAPVQHHLAMVIDRLPQRKVEILDVGAGPLTVVGKTHPTKQISITATDVLAREYDALLDEAGIDPPVPTIFAEAEKLRERFGGRRFDIVHAQNSLDHSADPFAAIEEMLALAKPGGFLVLLHEENEGRNERYHALHKWDFTCERGHFVIAGPGPGGARRDVTAMLSGRAEIYCTVSGGEILVTIRKLPEHDAP